MSEWTEKVRETLEGLPVGRTVIATDMDDACLALFNAAPTLLREACERITKLEKVAEAARDILYEEVYGGEYYDSLMDTIAIDRSTGKNTMAVSLFDALSALDAKEQS